MMIYLISIAATVFLVVVWFIATNNNLIARRNKVKQCHSGICVALKQRNDLIPNLVAAAKAYMGHENETLTRITELRSQSQEAKTDEELIETGNRLSAALGGLSVQVERYPELKANVQFLKLHDAIENMEDELQAIRRTYNAAVVGYNNKIEMFPSSIVATSRGHRCAELIDIPEAEKVNVDVNALFGR